MKKTLLLRAAMMLLTMVATTVWAAQPDNYLDACLGGDGYIYIRGWAYDPDASEESIDVHVYIYTDAGCTRQYVNHLITTDVLRTDVNEARHITGNHGFLAYIPINDAGDYWVKIFAYDWGDDGDPQIGNTTKVTVNNSQEMTLWGSLSYTTQDGKVLIGTTSGTVTIPAGANITLKNVTITGGIVCAGSATITLVGTNSVTCSSDKAGIKAGRTGTTLTIKGNGSLTATGGSRGAGIGAGGYFDCGNIIIEGGNITAIGGNCSAGIGSSETMAGSEPVSCGNITISGGTVTATGGEKAAGIGSGYDGSTCGDITISGGTVIATGGDNAAGIGSSRYSTCGDITISGGTVTATGGDFAAGIGGGFYASCGNITINNGVTYVTAAKGGNSNAPNSIGAGSNGTCGSVTIGGIVTGNISQSPFVTYPYTVTFNANGGTGTIEDMSFMYNVPKNLSNNTFTNTNGAYIEWNTQADGSGTAYPDGQNVNNLASTSGATVTLYAQWQGSGLVDGTAYRATQDGSVSTATYTRTITGERVGKHQPWLVPFDHAITSDDLDMFSFYKINMIANAPNPGENTSSDQMWVFLTKLETVGTVLHANMPYVIKAKVDVTGYAFTSTNVTLKAPIKNTDVIAKSETLEDIYSFYATYEDTPASDSDKFYYVSSQGNICLGTSVTIGPYRWIVRKTSKFGNTTSYAPEMRFFDGEEDATGIENLNVDVNLNETIYNVAGQRLNKMQKGINIVNGRKILK